jgi:hypothetical protein
MKFDLESFLPLGLYFKSKYVRNRSSMLHLPEHLNPYVEERQCYTPDRIIIKIQKLHSVWVVCTYVQKDLLSHNLQGDKAYTSQNQANWRWIRDFRSSLKMTGCITTLTSIKYSGIRQPRLFC